MSLVLAIDFEICLGMRLSRVVEKRDDLQFDIHICISVGECPVFEFLSDDLLKSGANVTGFKLIRYGLKY